MGNKQEACVIDNKVNAQVGCECKICGGFIPVPYPFSHSTPEFCNECISKLRILISNI